MPCMHPGTMTTAHTRKRSRTGMCAIKIHDKLFFRNRQPQMQKWHMEMTKQGDIFTQEKPTCCHKTANIAAETH